MDLFIDSVFLRSILLGLYRTISEHSDAEIDEIVKLIIPETTAYFAEHGIQIKGFDEIEDLIKFFGRDFFKSRLCEDFNLVVVSTTEFVCQITNCILSDIGCAFDTRGYLPYGCPFSILICSAIYNDFNLLPKVEFLHTEVRGDDVVSTISFKLD